MNRVVHFEINAENVERASKFYRAVFGWKIEPWGPPESRNEKKYDHVWRCATTRMELSN